MEKFAESREKWFRTEDRTQKHGYTISSYEPLADLFFLYFLFVLQGRQLRR